MNRLLTYTEVLNEALIQAMGQNPAVMVLGENIRGQGRGEISVSSLFRTAQADRRRHFSRQVPRAKQPRQGILDLRLQLGTYGFHALDSSIAARPSGATPPHPRSWIALAQLLGRSPPPSFFS